MIEPRPGSEPRPPSAADALIAAHRHYARALAREISRTLPAHVEYDDLAQAAELGLVEAAQRFDATRGAAFSTFAYYRIRGAMFEWIRRSSGIPRAVQREATLRAGQDDLLEATGPRAEAADDPEQLAAQFKSAVERLGIVYLASQAEGDEPADTAPGTAETAEQHELIVRVREAVEALPPEEREIIRLLYFERRSMAEVGKKVGKDTATICRRHRKALDVMLRMMSG